MSRILKQYYLHTDKRLSGLIYDDDRFSDGDFITTTPIQSISDDNRTVTTRSGTTYTLDLSETHCQADIRELLGESI